MIAPSILVNAMTSALGEEEGAVRVALRRLRDHHLIGVGGRGRNVIRLPLEAVSRLLIGLVAAKPLEKESALNAVRRFEPLSGGLVDWWVREGAPIEATTLPLDDLAEQHEFGAALQALLLSASKNELLRYQHDQKWFVFDLGYIEITFFNPLPAARIEQVRGTFVRKVWKYGLNADSDRYLSAVHGSGLAGPSREVKIDQTELNILGKTFATGVFDPKQPTWEVT